MDLQHFILSLCFFSEPKSLIDPEPDKDIKVFNHQDINKLLNTSDTFHFDRGEPNFFSQYGKASYAFWAHSFYLEKEEIESLNDSHDAAIKKLFEKLKWYLTEINITERQIINVKEIYNCRCEVLLAVPISPSKTTFKITKQQLKTLVDIGLDFSYWPLEIKQLNQLK